MSIMM